MSNLNNKISKIIFEVFEFNNNKTFYAPLNVKQACQNALNIISNNNLIGNGGNEGSGANKAKELISGGAQNHAQMKRMKAFFDNNKESVNKEKLSGKSINDSGIIQSWELHGGDAGMNWVNSSISSLKDSNLNTKKNARIAGGAGKNKGLGSMSDNPMSTNNTRNHSVYSYKFS